MRYTFFFLITLIGLHPIILAQHKGLNKEHSKFGQAKPSKDKIEEEANALWVMLEKNHYQPRPMDDSLSRQIFMEFIHLVDPSHHYLLTSDIVNLQTYEFKIDDELKGEVWNFFPTLTSVLKKRLEEADLKLQQYLALPLVFNAEENITFLPEEQRSLDFPADESQYKIRWMKWLKYRCLWQIASLPESDKSSFEEKEKLARQKVLRSEQRKIKRILNHTAGFDQYLASLYFKAITACFDPHTVYLSRTDRENYEAQVSPENYSFGITLELDEAGNIKIEYLIPGGPAWKSNLLHKGDILLSLRWEGKERIDVSDADLQEVEAILQESNEGRMEMMVRTSGGQELSVTLVKEKLADQENIVKSFILKGAEKTIGYISLPGFYTEWENNEGLGCANDVAKEIVKLKEAGIEGLILDIRYNGGGSLSEGLDLAGIFINEGPLMMLKGRDGKTHILKDKNRGTVYDGPLVLMVNGQSASASEVLASTLQDYNRALIVGSRTYGKATGQVILPIDTSIVFPFKNDILYGIALLSGGVVTMTVEKLYRVNGQSAQIKGVEPDILLPDALDSLVFREEKYPFALPHDGVDKKAYYSPLPVYPNAELRQFSEGRLRLNPNFATIHKLSQHYPSMLQKNAAPVALMPNTLNQQVKEFYTWWNDLDSATNRKTRSFTIENTRYEEEVVKIDNYTKELNRTLQENLLSDIYIEEAFYIISDLIKLTQK